MARWLAGVLNLPHTELDALWWQPNWTAPDVDAFQAEVATVAQDQCWIVSGNHDQVAKRSSGLRRTR